MSDVAVRVNNVSKRFKLYHNMVTGPVQEILTPWRRHKLYKEFMAVKGVSMEVKRGEVVGIIGANGAGKSTLLKMIAGLLPVDKGQIEVNGTITALMAMGVGVQPEFTGRENILYSGMLLGMSKKEVQRKMPDIIEFSELGEYIDRPFRTYSTGMRARLLFSTFVSIEPDILIVDEALATGDTYFVQKSAQRIREICQSGATILFVSHNLIQVQQLCQRAYLMADGCLVDSGTPGDVIASYQQWVFKSRQEKLGELKVKPLAMAGGTGAVQLTDVRLRNSDGEPSIGFYTNDPIVIEMDYVRLDSEVEQIHVFVGVSIVSTGQWVAEFTNFQEVEYEGLPRQGAALSIQDSGTLRVTFDRLLLMTNDYNLRIMLGSSTKENYTIYADYHAVQPFAVAKRSDPFSTGPIVQLTGTFEHQ